MAMKNGSTGDDVKKLQQQLKDAGFDPGGIDGIYGPNTEAAVKKYQKAKGLADDGIAGPQTLGSLTRKASSTPAAPALSDAEQKIKDLEYQYGPLSPGYADAIRSGTEDAYYKEVDNIVRNTPVEKNSPAKTTPQKTTPQKTTPQKTTSQNTIEMPSTYVKSPYEDKILSILDKLSNEETPEYESPFGNEIKTLLASVKNRPAFEFNPETDPGYGVAQKEGEKIFQNQVGNMSAMTGGRLNSWASSTASRAQDDYMGNALANMESKAYNRYENEGDNLLQMLGVYSGLDETAYNRNRAEITDARNNLLQQLGIYTDMDDTAFNRNRILNQDAMAAEDRQRGQYISTIGQYSDDYQKEINNLTNDGDPSNDWQIPLLKTARQEKIAGMQSAEASAQDKAKENAITMWKLVGVATPEISQALGVPVGAKTADYQNMLADNARASENTRTSSEDQGLLLQGMLSSGNPAKWLEDNADWLGGDDYKFLAPYAKGMGIDTSKLFSNASRDEKNYYDTLKDIYMGGGSGQYKDNPQAALDQLRREPRNKELLGSLYPVLESELASMIEQKSKTGDPLIDSIANEMIGADDPMAVINKHKGKLTSAQIKELTSIAKSLMIDEY